MAINVPQKNDFDIAENIAKRVYKTQWSSAGVSLLYLILCRVFPEYALMEFLYPEQTKEWNRIKERFYKQKLDTGIEHTAEFE